MAKLQLVQDPAADALLESNPFALLVGMLLDQQYPMEEAFAGPKKIADRIGGVDPREIADYNPGGIRGVVFENPCDTPLSRVDGQADPRTVANHR